MLRNFARAFAICMSIILVLAVGKLFASPELRATTLRWAKYNLPKIQDVTDGIDVSDVLSASEASVSELGPKIYHQFDDQFIYDQQYVMVEYLTIIAKTEKITVESIEGNRGNCNLYPSFGTSLPKDLKFGDSIKMTISCNSLIEAEVKTDLGVINFAWDR